MNDLNAIVDCRKNDDGLLEIKHDTDDSDNTFFELKERSSLFHSEDRDVHALPLPKPPPKGVHTLRIPSSKPRKIQKINLNPVR